MRALLALRVPAVCTVLAVSGLALPAGAQAASCFGDPPDLEQLGTIVVNKGNPQGISYHLNVKGPGNITVLRTETFVRWRMPQRPEVLSPVFDDLSAPPDSTVTLPAARTDDPGASKDPNNGSTLIPFQIYGDKNDQVGDYDVTLTARGVRSDVGPCQDDNFRIGTVSVVCHPPTCTRPCSSCAPSAPPRPSPPGRCTSCEQLSQSKCVRSLGRLQWWRSAAPQNRSVKCNCGAVCTCNARAIAQGRLHTATFRVGNKGKGRVKLLRGRNRRCTPRLCGRAQGAASSAWSRPLQPVSLLRPAAAADE
jgi:hypothetical protein